MKEKRVYLIFYWLLYISGLASYYYVFIDYGFGVTVATTVVCGLLAILIANAVKNRLLILFGVFLLFSSVIFIGIIALVNSVSDIG